jgi:hypothetical protein
LAVVHRDRGVAKHAVLGLVKVAALEGAAAGLTANAVAPGWMRTPLADNQIRDHIRLRGIGRDDVIASMVAEQPARRFVDPAEVAALITFPARADRRSTAPASPSTPAPSPADKRQGPPVASAPERTPLHGDRHAARQVPRWPLKLPAPGCRGTPPLAGYASGRHPQDRGQVLSPRPHIHRV